MPNKKTFIPLWMNILLIFIKHKKMRIIDLMKFFPKTSTQKLYSELRFLVEEGLINRFREGRANKPFVITEKGRNVGVVILKLLEELNKLNEDFKGGTWN